MLKIYFENQTGVKFKYKYKRTYKKAAKELLKLLDIKGRSELNVIVTDNKTIRKISKEYKKKDKATDVLSFPGDFKNTYKLIGYFMLGDIYISYQKVKEQAKKYKHSEKREWTYLLVHGLLHCLGYNHQKREEENEMDRLADKIMRIIKVGRDA